MLRGDGWVRERAVRSPDGFRAWSASEALACWRNTPCTLLAVRLVSRAPRGFTLIELMAVIVIIGILAVVSVPTINRRLEDRRVQQNAEQIAQVYRTARAHAIGRGTAVLVRFQGGGWEVREAVRGTLTLGAGGSAVTSDVACDDLPGSSVGTVSSCLLTAWTNPDTPGSTNRVISGFRPDTNVTVSGFSDGTTAATFHDLCFTPMGRVYSRTVETNQLTPMNAVPRFEVSQTGGVGLTRNVLVPPNGAARTGQVVVPP